MRRYTKTELEKLLYIHNARVDQIMEKACKDLDEIVKPSWNSSVLSYDDFSALATMMRANSIVDSMHVPEGQVIFMNSRDLGMMREFKLPAYNIGNNIKVKSPMRGVIGLDCGA